jgi:hypothetical protein
MKIGPYKDKNQLSDEELNAAELIGACYSVARKVEQDGF